LLVRHFLMAWLHTEVVPVIFLSGNHSTTLRHYSQVPENALFP
jgi:hypothetical protein